MTLNQLVYFQKIAALENYRKAAEELFISQPSLSRAMGSLEEELGVLLFEKAGRGMRLTKAGQLFMEYVQQILSSCQTACSKMEEIASGGGSIEIGYIFPLAGQYIPSKVRNFLSQAGNEKVSFKFWQNHTPAIYKRVKEGELDIGFGGCLDTIDMEFVPLLQQELVIITPPDHPLSAFEELPLSVLRDYPLIGYDCQSWMGIHTNELYKVHQLSPNIIVECPDEYSIVSLVRENFGIALVPMTDLLKEAADIVIHKIQSEHLYHQIYMFWDKDRYHLPAVERFIEYMKDQAEPAKEWQQSSLSLQDVIRF